MKKIKVWLPLFSKISCKRIGDKPYFGNFGHSFVQIDEDTHPYQDKSGWSVSGRSGNFLFWKIFDCSAPFDRFLIEGVNGCQSKVFN